MHTVTFSWDDAVGEANYLLMLGDYANVSLDADTTSYVWQDPPCGVSVQVTLMARDAGGAEIGRVQVTMDALACLPDLVVIDMHFEPDPVVRGEPFDARFTVLNQGDGDAGPFTIVWHFHDALGINDCQWNREQGLAAGHYFGGRCTRNTGATPGHAPTVLTVDVDNTVNESDETNNEASLTIEVAE